jgi:23S rRNA pseudouridine2605 synthase
MPRDNDKNNDSRRGRRDGPPKGRSGKPRGPEKKFAKRGFADKRDDERSPRAGRSDGARPYGKKPYAGAGKPYAGKRAGPPRRRDFTDKPRRDFADRPRREEVDAPRPARFNRDDRGLRKDFRPRDDRSGEKRAYTPRSERNDTRPAARFADRKFGDKRPYTPRGEGGEKRTSRGEGFRKDGDRAQGDRPERKFGGDRKFSRGAPDRARAKEFGSRPDRGDSRPWPKRDASSPDHAGRNSRPRDGARNFDRPRFDKPRFDKPREDRSGDERPRFSRPREDRPQGDRPRFDRPHEDRAPRNAWQEHPRSGRPDERPRRDNEDDAKIFAKRPAFGGRGGYRDRKPDFDKRGPREEPKPKKTGERIAKVLSRAGLASRRDAEEMVVQGRVAVNGRVINSPALDVTVRDVVTVDGKPLPERERTRLFLYHKPRGLMTTHADPEGRRTVFDNLPEGLPRLISIGRLDFNTEGLLLLTNDGGLARVLELPDTGWLRRYRVRAHGEVTQAQLDELKKGIEVDGVKYGPIDAVLERDQGANVWLVFAIREGKNREVRNVMAHLGLEVNRLIRVSYGPFQLGELAEGEVEEVKTRVLREQLGDKIAAQAGAEFAKPMQGETIGADAARNKKPFKASGKNALIADRKGRRVLVQRSGSEEARLRNELEANGYGPPRRPQRGYHGKRDLRPLEE